MPDVVVPMPLAELLERLRYAGISSTCAFEPPEVRSMYATVQYLGATLKDERAAREKLQAQLAAAQRAFEGLDAKYQRAKASKPSKSKRRAA
jgi:hypothetical protein